MTLLQLYLANDEIDRMTTEYRHETVKQVR